MSETLLSILCGEDPWYFEYRNTIKFNTDGTGELWCTSEAVIFIAAEFDWKPKSPESLNQAVDLSTISNTNRPPHLISQFEIELTLAKRRVARLRTPDEKNRRLNEALLTDEAFTPKTYTIRLEKGNFLIPVDAMLNIERDLADNYELRLVFDKSPYPARHEWKEPTGAPDLLKMWEWKEFGGRASPELKRRAKKNAWLSNCVVS